MLSVNLSSEGCAGLPAGRIIHLTDCSESLHWGVFSAHRNGGRSQSRGSGDQQATYEGDSPHGAWAVMNVDGLLDLNLMGRVIHSIDSFLPASSLPVMSSR